jgi:uncharacterized protein (UPF0264 family)
MNALESEDARSSSFAVSERAAERGIAATPIKLLVSARSLIEAQQVMDSGAHWLDLKEPSRGSLGRPDLDLIWQVLDVTSSSPVQVSVAGGEITDWTVPCDQELAAKLPERVYLKIALANCNANHWIRIATRISASLRHASQLILVHYADSTQAQCPDWQTIVQVSESLGCRHILIDTFGKRQGGLLDYLSLDQLAMMIESANRSQLSVALAGSLRIDQLEKLGQLGASWLGVRGAVCVANDRTSTICPDRLQSALSVCSHHSRNEL